MVESTKILVPVDGSRTSLLALEYLRRSPLGDPKNLSIQLLAVQEETFVGDLTTVPVLVPSDQDLLALNQTVGDWSEVFLAIELTVRQGPVTRTICAVQEEWQPDLTVMTSHGRTGMARVAWGSVAGRVGRHSRFPLLVLNRSCLTRLHLLGD